MVVDYCLATRSKNSTWTKFVPSATPCTMFAFASGSVGSAEAGVRCLLFVCLHLGQIGLKES